MVLISFPTLVNTPMILKISAQIYHDIPHGTEHHTVLKISPTVLMISPMILNTFHGTEHPYSTEHTLYGGGERCGEIVYRFWFCAVWCPMDQIWGVWSHLCGRRWILGGGWCVTAVLGNGRRWDQGHRTYRHEVGIFWGEI